MLRRFSSSFLHGHQETFSFEQPHATSFILVRLISAASPAINFSLCVKLQASNWRLSIVYMFSSLLTCAKTATNKIHNPTSFHTFFFRAPFSILLYSERILFIIAPPTKRSSSYSDRWICNLANHRTGVISRPPAGAPFVPTSPGLDLAAAGSITIHRHVISSTIPFPKYVIVSIGHTLASVESYRVHH